LAVYHRKVSTSFFNPPPPPFFGMLLIHALALVGILGGLSQTRASQSISPRLPALTRFRGRNHAGIRAFSHQMTKRSRPRSTSIQLQDETVLKARDFARQQQDQPQQLLPLRPFAKKTATMRRRGVGSAFLASITGLSMALQMQLSEAMAAKTTSSFPTDIGGGSFPTDIGGGGGDSSPKSPPPSSSSSSSFPQELGGGSSEQLPKSGGFPTEIGGDNKAAPSSPASPPSQPKQKQSFSFQPSDSKKAAESPKSVQRSEDDATKKAANVEPIKRRGKSKRKRTIEKSAEAEERLTQLAIEDLQGRKPAISPYRRSGMQVYTRVLDYNAKSAGVGKVEDINEAKDVMLKEFKRFRSAYSRPLLSFISFSARDASVQKFEDLIEYVEDKLEQNPSPKPLSLDMDQVVKYVDAWEDAVNSNEAQFETFLKRGSVLRITSLDDIVKGNRLAETPIGKLLLGLGVKNNS